MGLLTPDMMVGAIQDIDIQWLVDGGVRCVLVDRDNTCVPRRASDTPPEVVAWFGLLAAAGISACIVSNNFRDASIGCTARQLGCGYVSLAWKPSPVALRRVLSEMGCSPDEAIMIGDQTYTDVVAGNLAGITTVLVAPQDRAAEPLYTKAMRWLFEHRGRVWESEMGVGEDEAQAEA